MADVNNISNFPKAKKLYNQIVYLDKEILQIGKIANEIVSDKCSLEFSISVENHSKKNKEVGVDEEERPSISGWFAIPIGGNSDESLPNLNKETHSFILSESNCLLVLENILKIKHKDREGLLTKLNKLGVKY